MSRLACACAAALVVSLSGCFTPTTATETSPQAAPMPVQAKPAPHSKKPEPTQQELFDYVRGKLIALSPNDGINDNQEVTFDAATSILSITQPDGRCDIYLGAIDTSSLIWEVFDPSDTYHPRSKVLRVTLTSLSGKRARTCYDSHNQVDKGVPPNRARLLFSLQKTNGVPNFQDNMSKAIKKLVLLAGGSAQQDIF